MVKGDRPPPLSWHPRFSIDPHPFARGGSVAICAVSAMHIAQAVLLMQSSAAANATPISALIYVFAKFGSAVGLPYFVWWLPPALCASAALALVGALFRLGWIRLAIFIPQHFLLGAMVVGSIYAVGQGAYLDGTVKPWQHIAADQIGMLALFIVYSSAILRRCSDPDG